MSTRSIDLTPEQDRFVEAKVKSGRYANANEVVCAGLRALGREEREFETKLESLRAAIDEGDNSGLAEDEVFASVRKQINLPR